MTSTARTIPAALLLGLGILCGPAALSPSPPRDLDVAVPPGSPLEWGRSFPAITPGGGPLFPTTPSPGAGQPRDPDRTISAPARPDLDLRTTTSFGLVRILTWDLAAHLRWIRGALDLGGMGPTSGRHSFEASMPAPGDALYWVCLAPLLRLMLHPGAVNEAELLAHLVELGEPTLGVLDSARSERSLAAAVSELHERIYAPRKAAPVAIAADTPRETMLSRFVFEELLSDHPYDPEAAFGARLFLLGDELLPFVLAYTRAEDSFLRRNAVAALGRYPGPRAAAALVELAAVSEDAVVVVRALAALGRQRRPADSSALVKRLRGERDPVLRSALIGALGRVSCREAIDTLVVLGRGFKGKDADGLLGVLTALTRIEAPEKVEQVEDLADEVYRHAHSSPGAYRPAGPGPSESPDWPDPVELKGRTVELLALCVQLHARPTDQVLRGRLLGYAPQQVPSGPPRSAGSFYASQSLAAVPAGARFVFIETLRWLGEAGHGVLQMIAEDHSVEPNLRGWALSNLPWNLRRDLAPAVFERTETDEMRIQALGLMAADQHTGLEELARELLTECAAQSAGEGSSEQRFLYLSALRALEDLGRLKPADLIPLLHHPNAARAAHGDLPDRLRAGVQELVTRAAAGIQKAELSRRLNELLDLAIAAGINPRLTEETRADVLGQLNEAFKSARAHRNDRVWLDSLIDGTLLRILGYVDRSSLGNNAEFEPPVPLEEEILLALGRSRRPRAVAVLRDFLGNRTNVHRAAACLALGMAGDPRAGRTLVPLLLDDDAFVRLSAYESLRHLSGEQHFADWLYGERGDLTRAAELYFAWAAAQE